MPTYLVYGISIFSLMAIRGIPQSTVGPVDGHYHIRFDPLALDKITKDVLKESSPRIFFGKLQVIDSASILNLRYDDGIEFYIEKYQEVTWVVANEPCSLDDILIYLLGPVLAYVLRLKKVISLHASGININNCVLALIGPHGRGKSTTAAAFAKLGYPIMSDDVVPLRPSGDQFLVHPGYPRLRLWSSSVEMLYGTPDALPLITPNWDKRYLDLEDPAYNFALDPAPLGAIYILEPRRPDITRPVIETISGRDALMTLTANTYVNYLLDKEMRMHEFDVLQKVVKQVPVKRIAFPADPAYLVPSCEALIEDFQRGE